MENPYQTHIIDDENQPNEDSDDHDKHLTLPNSLLINSSNQPKFPEQNGKDTILSAVPKIPYESSDSPRGRLAQYIPESPFKFNVITTTEKTSDKSQSFSDEDSDNDQAYSKSVDYSEEISGLPQILPITRSISEDFLQRPAAQYQRRVSLVSSSKGRLAGVPRVHPKEAFGSRIRSPSIGVPPLSPAEISEDEEQLIARTNFTRRKILVAFCLCLCDFTAYLSMSVIAPFFPREASQKGMREAVSGLVFGIYALVTMLTSPIFGKLMPIFGAKPLFLCGVTLCGVSNICFGLLDLVTNETAFAVLCFVVRSFEALGAAAYSTASCTILIDQFQDNIGTIFGFIETAMGIGMSIGPALGGALYSIGGFSLPFFVLGGFCVSIVPLCWLLLRSVEDPKTIIEGNTVSYMKLLSMPHIVVVLFILAISSQSVAFIDPTLEPHLRQYGLTASYVGLCFLLFSGVYGITSPVVGWLSGKIENKYPLMIFGLLCVSIALLLIGPSEYLPIQGSMGLSIGALAFLGFSVAAAYIPTFESIFIAAMNNGLPDDINTYSVVSGLWNCFYSLGEVTGPALGGILSDFYDFAHASTIIAFTTIFAFIVGIIAWCNPYSLFGEYNLVSHAAEKQAMEDAAQNQHRVQFSRESTPLQNGSVHTYGSLVEDKKDPLV